MKQENVFNDSPEDMNFEILSAIEEEKRLNNNSYFPNDFYNNEEPADESSPRKLLKRDIRRMALLRLEDSARTEEDFKEVINIWDRNDSNRERKEHYHEIGRSVVPLEYGAAKDGVIFPLPHNKVLWKQILKGDFIDTIFNCPFEMHELVEDEKLSDTIYNLKPEHKELLYYLIVKNLSPRQIATIKQCTDRNIRKVKTTLLNKLRLEAGYEQYI